MAQRIDIALQRNEDWARSWQVRDGGDQIVDLTGWTVAMQVKDRLNNTTIVSGAVCTVTEPTAGLFTTVLKASEGFPLNTYGDPLQTINLPYDIRIIDPSGIKVALVAGVIILARGVTQNV